MRDDQMQSYTCFVKKEKNQYASLCIELDIASCGNTKKEATLGLKHAIEAYIEFMISEKRETEIYRPVPMNALKDFLFPYEASHEQSFHAIPLEVEYAV
jgi:predicted RNase H-like HicB family nuclease